MSNFKRPTLDRLEDRTVPAYLWRGANDYDSFNVAANWYNTTTSAPAHLPPGPGTTCVFDSSSTTHCLVPATGSSCVRLLAASYPKKLFLDGELDVYGKNSTYSSIWDSSEISAYSAHGAALNIIGGVFEYWQSSFNDYNTRDFRTLVNEGGELTLTGTVSTINSEFKIGYDPAGNNNTNGRVNIFSTNAATMGNNYAILVRSGSALDVRTDLTNAQLTSYGDLYLNGGDLETKMAVPVEILGGSVIVKDTGTVNVIGDMNVTSAQVVLGGLNTYSTLNVTQDLSFKNGSSLKVDVNQLSLTACDVISASNVFITGTTSLTTYDNTGGSAISGQHNHQIIQCINTLTGTFSSVTNNTFAWTGIYGADVLSMNKLVP